MKKLLLAGTLFFLSAQNQISAQSNVIVLNKGLLSQITKNQLVRLQSNKALKKSYEEQNKIYDRVNKNMMQIITIQEYIHKHLTNVHSAVKQSKKIIYIYEYIKEIGRRVEELINYTYMYPQYAVLYSKLYIELGQELIKLKKQVVEEILKEDKHWLMDAYDRELALEIVLTRLRNIHGYVSLINLRLQFAKESSYISQIPVLNGYVDLDRAIINDIVSKYKSF